MNILFYDRFFPDPEFGGIERVVSVVGQALGDYGVTAYVATPQERPNSGPNIFILGPPNSSTEQELLHFIEQNNITHIISHYVNDPYNELFVSLRDRVAVQFIVFLHFSPGYEKVIVTNALCRPQHKEQLVPKIKRYIKVALKPLYLRYATGGNIKAIRNIYHNCDRFLLLSERFKSDFLSFYHIDDRGDKITVIPNPLSFVHFCSAEEIVNKKRQVLIVARHEEFSKRILLALKIWSEIELRHQDWELVLVGEGENTKSYKDFVKKHSLRHVRFEGKQNPLPYYASASIFMMTSLFEGFGITLTEAQQMGVVPIAFDSYKSLHDIIENEKTGIIVPNNNTKLYAERLSELMLDDQKRVQLALQAVTSSKQFAIEPVVKRWLSTINQA